MFVLVFAAFVASAYAHPIIGLKENEENSTLKGVVVLFRHGDRAPLSAWPNDVYFGDSSNWPEGYGQLNNKGKQRHYQLGQWFRNRYNGFLPQRYNRSDIYVRSTDVDRTLMSAASNLAGLYPPQDNQVWNENILWQAIPIHTTPEEEDHILAASIPCDRHEALVDKLLKSDEFQELFRTYSEFFKNISEVTGYDQVDLGTVSGLFSTITIYKEYNLELPSWTEQYWPEIKALAAKHFQISTFTLELARLRTGTFFNNLIAHFNSIRNQETLRHNAFLHSDIQDLTAPPKMLMLSAHDTTLADVTNALGVFPEAVPEFASTVIWEIRSRNNNDTDLFVNLHFKNSTNFDPLIVRDCDFDCGLDQFNDLLKPIVLTVEEQNKECRLV